MWGCWACLMTMQSNRQPQYQQQRRSSSSSNSSSRCCQQAAQLTEEQQRRSSSSRSSRSRAFSRALTGAPAAAQSVPVGAARRAVPACLMHCSQVQQQHQHHPQLRPKWHPSSSSSSSRDKQQHLLLPSGWVQQPSALHQQLLHLLARMGVCHSLHSCFQVPQKYQQQQQQEGQCQSPHHLV
mgnify:CR=1 FL=1